MHKKLIFNLALIIGLHSSILHAESNSKFSSNYGSENIISFERYNHSSILASIKYKKVDFQYSKYNTLLDNSVVSLNNNNLTEIDIEKSKGVINQSNKHLYIDFARNSIINCQPELGIISKSNGINYSTNGFFFSQSTLKIPFDNSNIKSFNLFNKFLNKIFNLLSLKHNIAYIKDDLIRIRFANTIGLKQLYYITPIDLAPKNLTFQFNDITTGQIINIGSVKTLYQNNKQFFRYEIDYNDIKIKGLSLNNIELNTVIIESNSKLFNYNKDLLSNSEIELLKDSTNYQALEYYIFNISSKTGRLSINLSNLYDDKSEISKILIQQPLNPACKPNQLSFYSVDSYAWKRPLYTNITFDWLYHLNSQNIIHQPIDKDQIYYPNIFAYENLEVLIPSYSLDKQWRGDYTKYDLLNPELLNTNFNTILSNNSVISIGNTDITTTKCKNNNSGCHYSINWKIDKYINSEIYLNINSSIINYKKPLNLLISYSKDNIDYEKILGINFNSQIKIPYSNILIKEIKFNYESEYPILIDFTLFSLGTESYRKNLSRSYPKLNILKINNFDNINKYNLLDQIDEKLISFIDGIYVKTSKENSAYNCIHANSEFLTETSSILKTECNYKFIPIYYDHSSGSYNINNILSEPFSSDSVFLRYWSVNPVSNFFKANSIFKINDKGFFISNDYTNYLSQSSSSSSVMLPIDVEPEYFVTSFNKEEVIKGDHEFYTVDQFFILNGNEVEKLKASQFQNSPVKYDDIREVYYFLTGILFLVFLNFLLNQGYAFLGLIASLIVIILIVFSVLSNRIDPGGLNKLSQLYSFIYILIILKYLSIINIKLIKLNYVTSIYILGILFLFLATINLIFGFINISDWLSVVGFYLLTFGIFTDIYQHLIKSKSHE